MFNIKFSLQIFKRWEKAEIIYHTQEIDYYSYNLSTIDVTTLISIFLSFEYFLSLLLNSVKNQLILMPSFLDCLSSYLLYIISFSLIFLTLLYTYGKHTNRLNKY